MNDFWSRRKAAVQAEQLEEIRKLEDASALERDEQLLDRSDAEILEDLGLPDPDDMREGDDFSVFLAKAVPNRIRTRALRKLWLTNPVLANVDGLVDYGEDFTDAACVIENLQTAYQVGKGMTQHVLETLRDDAPEEPAEGDLPEAAPDTTKTPEPPVAMAAAPETQALEPKQDEVPEDSPLPPRRMRFVFAEPETAA